MDLAIEIEYEYVAPSYIPIAILPWFQYQVSLTTSGEYFQRRQANACRVKEILKKPVLTSENKISVDGIIALCLPVLSQTYIAYNRAPGIRKLVLIGYDMFQ